MANQDYITNRIITKDNVLDVLASEDVIQHSYIFFRKGKKKWKISKSVTVQLSDGKIITIPEGYMWDMASVPRGFWGLVSPYNDGLLGTLIHDFMYTERIGSLKAANKEYLFWNNITNKNKFDNYLRYIYVSLFGWLAWYDIVKLD